MKPLDDPQPWSTSEKILFASIVALGLAIRLSGIDARSLHYDEIMTALSIRKDYLGMLYERFINGHTPVYFSGMWIWTRVFGDSLLVLRLPATLVSAASIAVVYLIVRRIAGSGAAWLASGLLALHQHDVVLAQVARMYPFVSFFSLVGMFSLVHGGNNPTRRDLAIFSVATLLGLYTSHSFLLPLAGQIVYLMSLGRRAAPWWRALGLAGLGFSPFLFCLLFFHSIGGALSWIESFTIEAILRMPETILYRGEMLGPYSSWSTPAALAIVAMAAAGAALFKRTLLPLIAVWLVPIAIGILVSVLGPNIISQGRYFLVSSVLTVALAGLALAWLRSRSPRFAWLVIVPVFFAFGTVTMLSRGMQSYIDFGTVARILHEGCVDSDEVLLFTRFRSQNRALSYYYREPFHRVRDGSEIETDADTLWICLPDSVRGSISGSQPSDPERARLLESLKRQYPVHEEYPVRNGSVLRLSRPAPSGLL